MNLFKVFILFEVKLYCKMKNKLNEFVSNNYNFKYIKFMGLQLPTVPTQLLMDIIYLYIQYIYMRNYSFGPKINFFFDFVSKQSRST